jgi:carboxylesterase type B
MHVTRFISLASVLLAPTLAAVFAYQIGGPVSTTSGLVTGTAGRNAQDVSAYLGIPFALPPVAARRWAAPERFKSDKAINATKFGADCPGTLTLGAGGPPNEDCLSLSVWVPPRAAGDAPKAVMVWIYGGAFVGGSSAMSMTDGSSLAKNQDVIVVAINYRLAILGFPGAPGLADQNLGLLDQRAAVEWTRDNIAGFGGDPNKIVLVRGKIYWLSICEH